MEVVEAASPGTIPELLVGRVRVVDAVGRALDLDSEASDGDAMAVVPVPHPGTKPI